MNETKRMMPLAKEPKHRHFLVIANLEATFVKDDVAILKEFGKVTFWNTKHRGMCAPELIRLIAEADLVYCWFASLHSLLPSVLCRLKGKPLIVVSGGYDSADIPEIGYGNARHGIKKYVSRFILNAASAVIVNSEASKKDALQLMPSLDRKLTVIPHRINPIYPVPIPPRQTHLLLTVARLNRMNYHRKKIELIKEIARQMPDYTIVHLGQIDAEAASDFYRDLPDNMQSMGFVPDRELWGWYHRAGALLAPSWHEGFGVTAAEAPAAGCLPFISGAGAQLEVTKGHAVLVTSDDPQVWTQAIRSNTNIGEDRREAMKQAMLEAYTGSVRKNGMKKLIIQTVDSKNS